MAQTSGNTKLLFSYDAAGDVVSVNYNGTEYFYLRNAQNDVVALMDNTGQTVVQYKYDSWGKLTSTSGTLASSLGHDNPFRYRGYYYDTETSLYYLQSRYYDPEVGRFISADNQLLSEHGSIGMNLFCYGANNPINTADPSGHAFMFVTAAIGAVVGAVVGGIVAASRGKNVWAGIGIGAAIGGVVGLTCGAAAGVVLAGSAMASTSAVIAGGAAMASTIATGGISSGLALAANNISKAVSNVSPVVQSTVSKMQDVATKGKAGEALSGITKNTAHIRSLTRTASYRIPDGLDKSMRILSEVKNYSGTLSYTNQLKDFVMWSQANGYQMHLYTNATLTGPLQQVVDSNIIQLFPLG